MPSAGADPGFHVRGGGAQYLKSKVFTRERRRREAMLGGFRGHAPPENF